MHLASWQRCNVQYTQRRRMTRETVYVTSERGVCFKGHVYFRKRIYSSVLLAAGSSLHKCIILGVRMSVCLCGCLSVNDTPFVRLPPFCYSGCLLTLFSCAVHPQLPTILPPRSDTRRGLCEHHLSLSHEWFYLYGHRTFLETRKSALYKSLFLFMDEQEWAGMAVF